MQKRKFTFLFLIATVLSYSTFAEAALQFLPRYQGGYGSRTQQGGKDKVCSSSYKYTCSGTGYAGGVGTSCNDLYPSCSCSTNYKWSGGSCVLKSCSDYGYSASKDNTKSCEEKTPRSNLTCYSCTACDNTYQYACSGTGYASTQENTKKCGNKYSECSCQDNYKWSDGKCLSKTCEDYGYSTSKDNSKACSEITSGIGNNNICYNCSACDNAYQYNCSSMSNASGGDGSSCGGKYQKCQCKTNYFWDNGSCSPSCTPSPCTGNTSCEGGSCTMFSSVSTGVATYSSCTAKNCNGEGYKNGFRALTCDTDKAGWKLENGLCNCTAGNEFKYSPCPNNASCTLGCNDKRRFDSCNSGYTDMDACYTSGGINYGPPAYWTAANMGL